MRGNFLLALAVVGLALAFPLRAAETIHWNSQRFINPYDAPTISVDTPSGSTSNVIELRSGGALKFAVPASGVLQPANGGTGSTNFAVPASGILSQAKGGTGGTNLAAAVGANLTSAMALAKIQWGYVTNSADGTVTNVFATPFTGEPPAVLLTAHADGAADWPYLAEVKTNHFIIARGPTNAVISWLALPR